MIPRGRSFCIAGALERFLSATIVFKLRNMEDDEGLSLRKRIGSHIDEIIKQLGWDDHIKDASYNNLNLLGEGFLLRESHTEKSAIATAAAIVSLGARYAGVEQKTEEKGPTEKIAGCDLCKSVHLFPQNLWAKQKKIKDELLMRS
jgi:hypothetical protein